MKNEGLTPSLHDPKLAHEVDKLLIVLERKWVETIGQ